MPHVWTKNPQTATTSHSGTISIMPRQNVSIEYNCC